MKYDKFLIIAVGALLAVILILLALGGGAFLCLLATKGPVTNDGPLMQKTYDYNGTLAGHDAAALDVTNINGLVDVREGDGDAFTVNVKTRGTELDYERYKVEFTQTDVAGVPTLKVEVRDTREPRTVNARYVADITVTVPRNKTYVVNVVTVNGNVDLGAFNCTDIRLAAVNGALDSRASGANATMVTVNGNIGIRTDARKGDMFLNSVNGAITVSVPADAPVSLNAHIVNGAISQNLPLVISAKSRLALVGKTEGYADGISIEATVVNGNIDVRGH